MALEVFPMYVGVILSLNQPWRESKRIPHVCGGDPTKDHKIHCYRLYSPCMWG